MNRTSTRHQAFTLNYAFVVSEGLADLKCRVCKNLIDTHQPDPSQPERILGTCPKCGTWYLIEPHEAGERTMVLQLPDLSGITPDEVSHPPS